MNRYKNEHGSVTIYALWMLGLTMLLLFLMVNMIKVYAAKEQATITAEQGAYAATDVIYESVYDELTEYIEELEEELEDLLEVLEDAIEIDEELIAKMEAMNDVIDIDRNNKIESKQAELEVEGLYENQAKMEAMDIVLTKKLEKSWDMSIEHDIYTSLREEIYDAIRDEIGAIRIIANNIVEGNNGETSETIIYLFDSEYRVKVKSEVKYEELRYQEFFTGISDNVPQEAFGPKIDFIAELNWFPQTIY